MMGEGRGDGTREKNYVAVESEKGENCIKNGVKSLAVMYAGEQTIS